MMPSAAGAEAISEDSAIAMLQLQAAGSGHLTNEMIASAIKRGVSMYGMAMPDSYTLKGLVLAERLDQTGKFMNLKLKIWRRRRNARRGPETTTRRTSSRTCRSWRCWTW